uniref:Uncharacterized protein n=2 Tax=Panagrolaimus sp. JU765 TaxID=591449 RepID=A0AC34R4T7_9BILA
MLHGVDFSKPVHYMSVCGAASWIPKDKVLCRSGNITPDAYCRIAMDGDLSLTERIEILYLLKIIDNNGDLTQSVADLVKKL